MGNPPRILIIDDVTGRKPRPGQKNYERMAMCTNFNLVDVTEEQDVHSLENSPLARAVFLRGQLPADADPKDLSLRNDLDGVITTVKAGVGSETRDPWAAVLLDIHFPIEADANHGDDGSRFGLTILKAIREIVDKDELPILMISREPEKDVVAACRRLKADGFISRNAEDDDVKKQFEELWKVKAIDCNDPGGVVGDSSKMKEVLEKARRAALTKSDVLLLGETGTGKGTIAKYIYDFRTSLQRDGQSKLPYVTRVIGQLPKEMLHKEMFGHERGAFTGAETGYQGIFEQANGGVLFLDEIGDVPKDMQQQLLKVVENKTVQRLAGTADISLDLQIVFATNKDLGEEVTEGRFREDLWYRLKSATIITISPLRERREDIPKIAEYWWKKICDEKCVYVDRDEGVLDLFADIEVPGNVRTIKELVNELVNYCMNFHYCDLEAARTVLARTDTVEPRLRGDEDRTAEFVLDGPITSETVTFRDAASVVDGFQIVKLADQLGFASGIKDDADDVMRMRRTVLAAGLFSAKHWQECGLQYGISKQHIKPKATCRGIDFGKFLSHIVKKSTAFLTHLSERQKSRDSRQEISPFVSGDELRGFGIAPTGRLTPQCWYNAIQRRPRKDDYHAFFKGVATEDPRPQAAFVVLDLLAAFNCKFDGKSAPHLRVVSEWWNGLSKEDRHRWVDMIDQGGSASHDS